ncbi:hypothetical protein [Candidatus Nitrosocosmicus sp. FF01]|uniref:hypothetical protein n=1 Tax=Candidatus Nitrosocosmicus sp. FF01 TaxID=3397670 RepID=UPI0039ED529F
MTFISDIFIFTERMLKGRERITCSICNEKIGDFRYEPMQQWNISGFLCSKCYSKKISDHYIKQQQQQNTDEKVTEN